MPEVVTKAVFALLAAALLADTAAAADDYPSRPIRLVVPYPAGGTPDVMGRAVARQLQKSLGPSIVIDNRTGAQGILGAELVARAPADGYTLLYTGQAFLSNVGAYRRLPYDVIRDFAPVTQVAVSDGYVVLVSNAVKARTVRELVDLSRSAAKPLRYGTPGVGSSQQLAIELFNQMSGARIEHVPYRGLAPAITAVIPGDEVQVVFAPLTVVSQHMADGRLRALATTSGARWKSMPDLPTVGETVPGYKFVGGWHGLFAPAKTPAQRIERLHAEVKAALGVPALRDYLVTGGYEPVGSSPADFRRYVTADLEHWIKLSRIAKIEPQ